MLRHGVYLSGVSGHQERVGSACYLENYSHTDVYQERVGSACYLENYSHTMFTSLELVATRNALVRPVI